MEALCQSLLLIGVQLMGQMDMPTTGSAISCPQLELLGHGELSRRVCGEEDCRVRAFFDRDANRVLLDESLDFTEVYPRSILLHELVHVIQNKSGPWQQGCEPGLTRELEAFRVQEAYLLGEGLRVPVSRQMRFYSCPDSASSSGTGSSSSKALPAASQSSLPPGNQ